MASTRRGFLKGAVGALAAVLALPKIAEEKTTFIGAKTAKVDPAHTGAKLEHSIEYARCSTSMPDGIVSQVRWDEGAPHGTIFFVSEKDI